MRTLGVIGLMVLMACESAPVTAPGLRARSVDAAATEVCDPMIAFLECDQPAAPVLNGYSIGITWASCLAPVTDVDSDGLDDTCEVALASKFAPRMMVSVGECNWDFGLDRLGGEYYYMVRRPIGGADRIRIAYLPAYYRDCGSHPHTGDSEFIAVDVQFLSTSSNGPLSWQFVGAFLSSHCGAEFELWGGQTDFETDPDCRYYDRQKWEDDGGQYSDVSGGGPEVWVSHAKHANYLSRQHCENSLAGFWNIDWCPMASQPRRFPIVHRFQNINFPESGAFQSCVPGRWGSALVTPGATETIGGGSCLASGLFQGWTRPISGGSTPYRDVLGMYLRMVAGFGAPPECTQDPTLPWTGSC